MQFLSHNLFRKTGILLVLLILTAFACDGGCGGCGDSAASIPDSPEGRVQQMAEHMPSGTEVAFFISDLKEMRSDLDSLKSRLGSLGVVDTLQKQLHREFGINPLDKKSWEKAGVAPDSGVSVSYYKSRVITMFYVENRQAFEKVLSEKAKNAFEIEAVTKTHQQGKYKMKVLSDDPARQIAWMYDGKLALVSMPSTSYEGAVKEGSATLVLAEFADAAKKGDKKSLGAAAEFSSFKDSLVSDNAISAYVNTTSYLSKEQVKKEVAQDPTLTASYEWSRQNLEFLGGGLDVTEDKAEMKILLGTKKGVVKSMKPILAEAPERDWSNFATENLLLGLRVSVNWDKFWKMSLESMPDEKRREFLRNLKQAGQSMDLDLEKEVLGKLSGNVGVFFYGVAGNPIQLMRSAQNPAALASKAGLIAVVEFKEKKAVDNLLAKIIGPMGAMAKIRPMTLQDEEIEGYRILEFQSGQAFGRVYIHGKQVAFATAAFSDEAIHKYFEGKRDEKMIGEVEGMNLGKEFATGDGFNGLYFNSKRAQKNLGSLLSMGGVGSILDSIEEAALKFSVDDPGPYALLTIDLTKATGGQKQGGQKQDGQKQDGQKQDGQKQGGQKQGGQKKAQ